MIPVAFDYVRPTSLADAVATLRSAGDEAKVLAGGQSLLPVLRLRLVAPSTVVTAVWPSKFWITPWLTRMIATRNDSGSMMRTTVRVRSTQKLPSVVARRRA